MVIYEVPEAQRGVRDEVRQELAWLGFGPLATSTWISPRDRLDAVADRLGEIRGLRLDLLTCRAASAERDREMTARCWDLAQLNRDYSDFVTTYGRKLASIRSGTLSPRRSLVLRTELVYDYRRFPFRDSACRRGWNGRNCFRALSRLSCGRPSTRRPCGGWSAARRRCTPR